MYNQADNVDEEKETTVLAGFAEATVNPPLGMLMEGLGQQGGIRSIHDDLYVRGLYLSHEEEELLILGCDLLFFTPAQVDRLKGAIGRVVDLSPRRIFLNCSHTHAGPRLTPWAYSGDVEPLYFAQIESAMMHVAAAAKAVQRPATVSAGMASTRMPRSRRNVDAEGKARWAPSEAGAICGALPVAVFKDTDGNIVSLLFSVSCHPTTWYELDVSADYPGVAMRLLNERSGTENAMFLQGAGGDAKPYTVAVDEDHWRRGRWEDVEIAGTDVANAVIARIKEGLTEITPNLKACLRAMHWPIEAAPSREDLEAVRDDPEAGDQRRAWATDMLNRVDRYGRLPGAIEIGIHGVKIGDGLRLVGLEGEAVAELGLLILDFYKDGVTFPMGYTNATRIYLTASHMRAEGGYEVDSYWEYGSPAPLAVGTEEIVLHALDELKTCGID